MAKQKQQITWQEYLELKAIAEKVLSKDMRSANHFKATYVPYYEGETEMLYRQFVNEAHRKFNDTMDCLQELLLGVYDPDKRTR